MSSYPITLSPSDAVIVTSILTQEKQEDGEECRWGPVVYSDFEPIQFGITLRISADVGEWLTSAYPFPFSKLIGTQSTLSSLRQRIENIRATEATVGEHTPTAFAIDQAITLVTAAENLVHLDPPDGDLDYYYGELGIEWRKGNRILRLTCFSDANAPARLDYGTMSVATPGEYKSDTAASADVLAARLDWLSGAPE